MENQPMKNEESTRNQSLYEIGDELNIETVREPRILTLDETRKEPEGTKFRRDGYIYRWNNGRFEFRVLSSDKWAGVSIATYHLDGKYEVIEAGEGLKAGEGTLVEKNEQEE